MSPLISRFHVLLLIIAAAVLLSSCSRTHSGTVKATQPSSGKLFSVSGTVTYDSKTVEGAQVLLVFSEPNNPSSAKVQSKTRSDKYGHFSFKSIPTPGKPLFADIIALKDDKYVGYNSAMSFSPRIESYYVANFGRGGYVDFMGYDRKICLEKIGRYEGRITDTSGKPIAGVKVRPCLWSLNNHFCGSIANLSSAVSDSNGKFVLEHYSQWASIETEKEGFAQCNSTRDPTIVMKRAGSIKGRVVDENGKPVPKITVLLLSRRYNSLRSTTTGQNGSYKFSSVLPDDCQYTICLDSHAALFARSMSGIYVKPQRCTKAGDIVARKGVVLNVRFRDVQSGKFIQAGAVNAWPVDYTSFAMTSEILGEKGCIKIRVMPGAKYRLGLVTNRPVSEPISEKSMIVKAPSSGTRDIVIKMRKLDTIKGKVLDMNGNPASAIITLNDAFNTYSLIINAQGYSEGPLYEIAAADSNGEFEMVVREAFAEMIAQGKPFIRAEDPVRGLGTVKYISLSELKKVDLVLRMQPAMKLKVAARDRKSGKLLHIYIQGFNHWYSDTSKDGTIIPDIYEGDNRQLVMDANGYKSTSATVSELLSRARNGVSVVEMDRGQ